jgi:hypothetical protein
VLTVAPHEQPLVAPPFVPLAPLAPEAPLTPPAPLDVSGAAGAGGACTLETTEALSFAALLSPPFVLTVAPRSVPTDAVAGIAVITGNNTVLSAGRSASMQVTTWPAWVQPGGSFTTCTADGSVIVTTPPVAVCGPAL